MKQTMDIRDSSILSFLAQVTESIHRDDNHISDKEMCDILEKKAKVQSPDTIEIGRYLIDRSNPISPANKIIAQDLIDWVKSLR